MSISQFDFLNIYKYIFQHGHRQCRSTLSGPKAAQIKAFSLLLGLKCLENMAHDCMWGQHKAYIKNWHLFCRGGYVSSICGRFSPLALKKAKRLGSIELTYCSLGKTDALLFEDTCSTANPDVPSHNLSRSYRKDNGWVGEPGHSTGGLDAWFKWLI